jgi:predicted dehydrogenase
MNANVEGVRNKAGKWPRLGFLEAGRLEHFFWESSTPCDIDGAGMAGYSCMSSEREIAFRYGATLPDSPEELPETEVAGLVVVSPGQADIDWIMDSLQHGIPVFCRQPPLLNGADAERVVSMARKRNCLFDIDFACRHINGMPELRQHIRQGDLGTVRALDLTLRFGKVGIKGVALKESTSWNYIIFHLLDLVLWLFDYPEVTDVQIYSPRKGRKVLFRDERQDSILARVGFASGTTVSLGYARRSSQCDAVIDMGIYGQCGAGAAATGNDSLFSFVVDRFPGARESGHGGVWRDRALTAWLEKLRASNKGYDENIESFVTISELVERANNR